MLYVSSRSQEGLFGVTDTDDNTEEFFTKTDLLGLVSKYNFEIDGVDSENKVCVVKNKKDTLRLFNQGKVHLAISTMTLENDRFGLRFRSKPTSGEMSFVSNQVVNISRIGVNRFSYDMGYSKSYRSDLTLDDIMMVLERFDGWRLVDCNIGGF